MRRLLLTLLLVFVALPAHALSLTLVNSGSNTSGFIGSPFTSASFSVTSGTQYILVAEGAIWAHGETMGVPTSADVTWTAAGSPNIANDFQSTFVGIWYGTATGTNASETFSVTEVGSGAWHDIYWQVFSDSAVGTIGAAHQDVAAATGAMSGSVTPTQTGSMVVLVGYGDATSISTPSGFSAVFSFTSTPFFYTWTETTASTSTISYSGPSENDWVFYAAEFTTGGGGGGAVTPLRLLLGAGP